MLCYILYILLSTFAFTPAFKYDNTVCSGYCDIFITVTVTPRAMKPKAAVVSFFANLASSFTFYKIIMLDLLYHYQTRNPRLKQEPSIHNLYDA